jgi:glycosyltransferase involved in cell wall biosynthesis
MRVLCVIDTLGRGGAERLVVTLAPALKTRGIDIEVAALQSPWHLAPELEARGIRVHSLGLRHRWSSVEAIAKLTRFDADVFWSHLYFSNLYASAAAWLTRSGAVWTLHSTGYETDPPQTRWQEARVQLERTAARTLRGPIVAVSPHVAREYERTYGVPYIETIPNAVDLASFAHPRATRAQLGLSDDAFVCLIPARYVPLKGYDVLIDALALLPRSKRPHCVALGHGPLESELAARAKRLAVHIEFRPSVPHEMLIQLMRASDAVLQPSLRESFGIAAAEAMAVGAPTVLANIPAFLALASNSHGALIVERNDAPSWARALERIMNDAPLRQRLEENGPKHITQSYALAPIAERWATLLRSAASARADHLTRRS